jgi:hypothetical protein
MSTGKAGRIDERVWGRMRVLVRTEDANVLPGGADEAQRRGYGNE